MLRRPLLIAALCLLALPAIGEAALPGTPTIALNTTATCWDALNRGATFHTCDYAGTQIALNGWSFKNGNYPCQVSGTFTDSSEPFTTTMNYGNTSYEFVVQRESTVSSPTPPIAGIAFNISCALTWSGHAGLNWGYRITGGTASNPIYTLHVHNGTTESHTVHCRVSYQNDLNQTRFFTWSPWVETATTAKNQIKVWQINRMTCAYTLSRTLTTSGTA